VRRTPSCCSSTTAVRRPTSARRVGRGAYAGAVPAHRDLVARRAREGAAGAIAGRRRRGGGDDDPARERASALAQRTDRSARSIGRRARGARSPDLARLTSGLFAKTRFASQEIDDLRLHARTRLASQQAARCSPGRRSPSGGSAWQRSRRSRRTVVRTCSSPPGGGAVPDDYRPSLRRWSRRAWGIV